MVMVFVFELSLVFDMTIVPVTDGDPVSLENTIFAAPPVKFVLIDRSSGNEGDRLFVSDELYDVPWKYVYDVEAKCMP